ncbi:DUF1501 domain-containing protein [Pelagicoccus mobilis]|uniref:DUF1501 domain-containing protein n=1 Tax=Pelagicoccus mobilis TaxID=415221 RepID=A0A934RXY6_9BACT|nr:DUF1501 domain-containing protein [Pelagicoccus mobilis]MBK1878606.1 DUF1501 domain-containing protein [Pelagicoccus mobilis]
MNKPDPTKLSLFGQHLLDRRKFLRDTASLVGSFSLLNLLQNDGLLASEIGLSSDKTPIRPVIDPNNPYASRPPHFDPAAKQLLIIFCAGAVSHVDTFDYKPELSKFHGMKPPGMPAVTFEGPSGNIHKPFWDFSPRGQSGKMVSDLLPNLGGMVDDFSFFHALHSETSAHPTAENFMSTGFTFEGFPSIGSWVSYALGTENQELPAFVAINDPRGMPRSAKNNWGNGFLPASFQGTNFSAASPIPNIATPDSISDAHNKATVDAIERLNAKHLEKNPGDSELAARIASYELAGKMQLSVPELTNIDGEPDYVLKEYGADSSNELKSGYAKNCILARRMIEKGVRCVQLFNGSDASGGNGVTNWDSHGNIHKTHGMQAEIMDQPTAALLKDLKRRGLLEDTLVVWCTEFGRMPFLQANGTGRDHNAEAFTSFMMGAGVKKGFSYGRSDEFGFKAIEGKTSVYDFNATILHLLGLDHERLSFYNNGLERRLTNVHGHVVKDVLA